jgi:hypothetical protein
MGQVVQEQGQEIQNMLRLFKQTTSTPLSGCLLQTPQDKLKIINETMSVDSQEEASPRKSPRLMKKNNGGKGIIKMAQDLIAKKCGIVKEDEMLERMTLQQYLDLYKEPLSKQSIEAILQLSKVTVEKEGKQKKTKKL